MTTQAEFMAEAARLDAQLEQQAADQRAFEAQQEQERKDAQAKEIANANAKYNAQYQSAPMGGVIAIPDVEGNEGLTTSQIIQRDRPDQWSNWYSKQDKPHQTQWDLAEKQQIADRAKFEEDSFNSKREFTSGNTMLTPGYYDQEGKPLQKLSDNTYVSQSDFLGLNNEQQSVLQKRGISEFTSWQDDLIKKNEEYNKKITELNNQANAANKWNQYQIAEQENAIVNLSPFAVPPPKNPQKTWDLVGADTGSSLTAPKTYDLSAAIKGGVPEKTIIAAGFNPLDVSNAQQNINKPAQNNIENNIAKPNYTTNPSQDIQNILSSKEYLGQGSWFDINIAKPIEPASNWILNTTKPVVESAPFQAVAGLGQIPITITKESFFNPIYNMYTEEQKMLSNKTMNPLNFAKTVAPTAAQVGVTAGLFAMGAKTPGTLFGIASPVVKTAAKSIFTATALTAGPVLFGSAFVNMKKRDIRANVEAFGTAALVTAPLWIPPVIKAVKAVSPNPLTARLQTTPFSEPAGLKYEPQRQVSPSSPQPSRPFAPIPNPLSPNAPRPWAPRPSTTIVSDAPKTSIRSPLEYMGSILSEKRVYQPTSTYMSNRLSTSDILSYGFRRPSVDTRTLPKNIIPDWAYEDAARVIGVESKVLKPVTTTVTTGETSSPLNTGVPEGWITSSPGRIMPIGEAPISIPDFPYSSPSKIVTAFSTERLPEPSTPLPTTVAEPEPNWWDNVKLPSWDDDLIREPNVSPSIAEPYVEPYRPDPDIVPVIPRISPVEEPEPAINPLEVPNENPFIDPYKDPEISPQEQPYRNPLLNPDVTTSPDFDTFVSPYPDSIISPRTNLSPFGLTESNTDTFFNTDTSLAYNTDISNQNSPFSFISTNTNTNTKFDNLTKTDLTTKLKTDYKPATKNITSTGITTRNPLLERASAKEPDRDIPRKPPVFTKLGKDDKEDKFNASNPPAGTITWRQGKYWKAIYPPYDQDKPVTLKNPPAGATVRTGVRSAYHTAQVLKGRFNGEIYADLGAQDVKFIGQGETAEIQFSKGGQYTDVGRSNPSKTLGMSVRNGTKTRRINKNVA
jgi:hypothetical protein